MWILLLRYATTKEFNARKRTSLSATAPAPPPLVWNAGRAFCLHNARSQHFLLREHSFPTHRVKGIRAALGKSFSQIISFFCEFESYDPCWRLGLMAGQGELGTT